MFQLWMNTGTIGTNYSLCWFSKLMAFLLPCLHPDTGPLCPTPDDSKRTERRRSWLLRDRGVGVKTHRRIRTTKSLFMGGYGKLDHGAKGVWRGRGCNYWNRFLCGFSGSSWKANWRERKKSQLHCRGTPIFDSLRALQLNLWGFSPIPEGRCYPLIGGPALRYEICILTSWTIVSSQ